MTDLTQADILALAKEAQDLSEAPIPARKSRALPWAALGILGLLITGGTFATFGPDQDLAFWQLLVVLSGFCTLSLGLGMLYVELTLPAIPPRDPAALVHAYLKHISAGRHDTAVTLLSAKARRTKTPRQELPGFQPETRYLDDPKELKAYWAPLSSWSGLRFTSMEFEVLQAKSIEPTLAVVGIKLSVSALLMTGVADVTTTYELRGHMLAQQRSGEWRLLYGGLPLTIDLLS